MNNVNNTLYIPLYGKAYVSKKGIILKDTKAEEIWEKEQFPLQGKAKSKWLAYYMGMRSAVFDTWILNQLQIHKDALILHLGCGMDSRITRIHVENPWYDIDFPEVIEERKRYYKEDNTYHMIGKDIRDTSWLDMLPEDKHVIVVMEGVSMYLTNKEVADIMASISNYFPSMSLLMDCYTSFAAKLSKYKNPINEVGVTTVYGIDDPTIINTTTLQFVKEHNITPNLMIDELDKSEKLIFKKLYAGNTSKKLYKLYEYTTKEEAYE